MMPDVENILNNDEFFTDNIDTSKERTEQHRKMACLKYVINRGNVSLLIYQLVKTNGHMKELRKLATKASIKYLLNASSLN